MFWRNSSKNQVEVFAVTRDAKRLQAVPPGVRVVQMDIASPGGDCFTDIGFLDVLIHLAWDGLPNYKSPKHF